MITSSRILLILLLLTSIMGCKSSRQVAESVVHTETLPEVEATHQDSTFAIYQRTPCFGMCPYFNLTIYESGYAVYEGKNFVDLIGFYHARFDKSSLQKIKETAESIQYFSLDEKYDNPNVTDLPTTTTGIMKEGVLKTVAARYKAPKALESVYQVLDELIEDAKWTQKTDFKY